MKNLIGPALLPVVLGLPMAIAQETPISTFVIERPTIIAFFTHVSDADLEKDPDTNEALSDFQLYTSKAGPRLKKAGIDFEVVSGVRFKVKNRGVVHTFKSGKVGVGYYFVAPGKQAQVEYGVHDDLDIVDIARRYFQLPIP